ncbi:hypothetical protein QSJ18_20060, partial [Gordonia sp. ABSL1-1]|uniref:hypothetical protein n=1 Tax=Gordonia sp. ABSL1-1 TaxID=3053923 RepID=UPI0025732676
SPELMKPYWAMNRIEYGHLFPDTRLFIIFGCSLGESDGWWWRHVCQELKRKPDGSPRSELVIYWWSPAKKPASREDVLDKFFAGAKVDAHSPERTSVQDLIQVVLYTDETSPVFLATP